MFNENNPLAMQRELSGVTRSLSGASIHTTFQGEGAYATHNCVNVPSMKLDAVLSRVVQRMMRGYHIHEVRIRTTPCGIMSHANLTNGGAGTRWKMSTSSVGRTSSMQVRYVICPRPYRWCLHVRT